MTRPEWQKMKSVTKDEMLAFIKTYPSKLKRDVCAIFDPPLVTWNDFSDGKVWPASVVAYCKLNRDGTRELEEPFEILETAP